jgi:hypothetical protein
MNMKILPSESYRRQVSTLNNAAGLGEPPSNVGEFSKRGLSHRPSLAPTGFMGRLGTSAGFLPHGP